MCGKRCRRIAGYSAKHTGKSVTSPEIASPFPPAKIDMSNQLPTPALLIDAEIVFRNIRRLSNYAAAQGIKLRPHTKTHKSCRLARMQLENGAIGLTVAKVSEAEAISAPGQDVLMAYPPVGHSRAARLATLARDRTMRAAVDSLVAINEMSAVACAADVTVGLLVDLDVGLGRTGAPSPEATLTLAQAIDRASGLRLDGLMIYPGHIWEVPDKQQPALHAVNQRLSETIDLWREHGLSAEIVSGGSTPTAYQSHLVPFLTEIRPGTYIFNDMNTVRGGFCTLDDCAARIVATVVSDALSGQVVIDSGSKTLTTDVCIPARDAGFGHIVEFPDARITKLSEEHGQVDVTACHSKPNIGDRVTVVPNHVCPCVNLQESVWWSEPDEQLLQLSVDARGKTQ
jgi:D-serine deaminase-like pyridoxal phosphate-dependent protein